MKKVMFAVVLSVVALTLALPSFAEDVAPRKEAKTTVKGQEVKGTITAIDVAKGSVTVKNHKDVETTFTVADTTKIVTTDKPVAALADLKVSEKVVVHYTEDATGKMTVTKITQAKEKAKAADKK